MDFDRNRVYTALNADEVKVGSKVIIAKNLMGLKDLVYNNMLSTLTKVYSECNQDRFCGEYVHKTGNGYDTVTGSLCYLIKEPEEKKLKWTDLKLFDKIQKEDGSEEGIVTHIDRNDAKGKWHICCGRWISDVELEEWKKVE